MTMAKYRNGPRTFADYLPAVSYNAGDVVVVGGSVAIADVDNPPNAQDPLRQGSLCVQGGVYVVAADAAYANLTYVYWDTVKLQVSTDVTATAYPFGWIVGGPNYRLDDGGPTGAAGLCAVLFDPQGLTPPIAASLYDFPRNLLDGGDATTNPWQRGTSFSSIAGTATYTADRWAVVANAASAAQFSQSADTTIAGYGDVFKWGRPSGNTDTHAIVVGQALETLDSVRTQGQSVTFSFTAKKGANYSGGSLTVQVAFSTTAGNDSAAHLLANSTNWSSGAASPGGYVINATQTLTGSYVRYQFTGTVPAGCTQLGVVLTWTPTGTAGADDNVYANGFQLEVGNGATPFEHRDVEVELALCQRYCYVLGGTAGIIGTGAATSATAAGFFIPFPTQMRTAPTAISLTTAADLAVYDYTSSLVHAISAAAFGSASVNSIHVTVTSASMTTAVPYVLQVVTPLAGNLVISADL